MAIFSLENIFFENLGLTIKNDKKISHNFFAVNFFGKYSYKESKTTEALCCSI